MYRSEHEAFFDAAEGKIKPTCSGDDGLISMSVCDAAMRSLREETRVIL